MSVVSAIRWLAAAVFLAAAGGKLRRGLDAVAADLTLWRQLPPGLERPAAIALIAAEALAGALLLAPEDRPLAAFAGAALGLVLSLTFTTAVSNALVRGHALPCGCFGATGLRVGPWLLALDLTLAGICSHLLLVRLRLAGDGSLAWTIVTYLLVGLAAQSLRARLASSLPPGPAPGTPLGEFRARTVAGSTIDLAELGRGAVLLALSPGCAACRRLAAGLTEGDGWERVDLVLLAAPDGMGSLRIARQLGIPPGRTLAGIAARRLTRRLKLPGAPVVLAARDGRVLTAGFPASLAAVGFCRRLVDGVPDPASARAIVAAG